jgi:D-alanyl-D-alanine carboxypeptidase
VSPLEQWVGEGRIVGGTAVVRSVSTGVRLAAIAHGLEYRGGPPITVDTAFRTASVTKLFTATTCLVLAERGVWHLSDPIVNWLPDDLARLLRSHPFADAELREILAHQSGIGDYAASEVFNAELAADPTHVWAPAEMLGIGLATPTGAPRGEFVYSDTGYLLAAAAIEQATNENLADAFRTHLRYDQHEMVRTFLDGRETARTPFAHHYSSGQDCTGLHATFDNYGGGGVVSTSAELAAFGAALWTGQLLTDDTLRLMHDWQITKNPNVRAGLGTFRSVLDAHERIGHTGYWGSFVHHFPDLDVIVAGSLNTHDPDADGVRLTTPLIDDLERSLLNEIAQPAAALKS